MKRKEMKVGMRVVPSGRGFTKYWNISASVGTVVNMDHPRFVKVKWDGFDPISENLKAVHLSPARQLGAKTT